MAYRDNFIVDDAISELIGTYKEERIRGFLNAGRYDLILGYAIKEKGAVVTPNDRLKFFKMIPVEQSTESENYEYSIEFKREHNLFINNGNKKPEKEKDTEIVVKKYTDKLKEYVDRETTALAALYDAKIRGKGIKPNQDWEKECESHITPEYKQLLEKYTSLVIKQGNAWDVIAFAEHVPFADLNRLEDYIIETKDSFKILAFAIDVKGANLDKLGKAIKKLGNTSHYTKLIRFKGITEEVEIEDDHVGIFEEKFGKVPSNEK